MSVSFGFLPIVYPMKQIETTVKLIPGPRYARIIDLLCKLLGTRRTSLAADANRCRPFRKSSQQAQKNEQINYVPSAKLVPGDPSAA